MSNSKKQSRSSYPNTLQSYILPFHQLTEHMMFEGKLLTTDQLSRINSSVAESGCLRDQALLSLINSGLRPALFLPIKVRHITHETNDDQKIEIELKKARNSYISNRTTIKDGSTIYEHIQASRLSHDEYLFASDKDANKPMTSAMLSQICTNWARAAGVEPRLGRASTIYYSAMLNKFCTYAKHYNYSTTALNLKTGHDIRATSGAYSNPKDIKK
ncbi:hypothetical protein [Pseudomonas putida]|uniref:hypothetical protein n=1 Tax=Pseudomonas TaxID=286 RepID=UPI001074C0EF|nr:hypothetical protein [Pseudomonas putida]MCG3643987.1 hypothetical protein [Pseudomonas putida]MDD2077444.1 hypothetical protein [Pseudomonas putida]TFW22687.1 hypothetical protein E4L40_14945 [Pseudomonas putida]HDS1694727.1 hypothetical protein [Pseudomonas putida]